MAAPDDNNRALTPQIRVDPEREDLSADQNTSSSPLTVSAARNLVPSYSPSPLSRSYTSSPPAQGQNDFLAPPGTQHFRDLDSHTSRDNLIHFSRSSGSSDGGSPDSHANGSNPFNDPRDTPRAGSDDDNVNTQTVAEKFDIFPYEGLLIYPEDVEPDDYLHNPSPDDKDRDCNVFTGRGFLNVGGLLLVILGVLGLFVAYPVA